MRYSQVDLKTTIQGITRLAENESESSLRNLFFSARDYLELFQTETENQALAWETILECKKQKKAKQ